MKKRNKQLARTRSFAAAQFKATCLALMDEVANSGSEIIITKHRRPIAKLAPVKEPAHVAFVNRSPGVILATRDYSIMAPVNPDWEVDADL